MEERTHLRYPRKINIGFQEGTCPLKCRKCLAFSEYAKDKKKVQKMSLDNAKILIDEISRMEKIPSIQPSIFTEPFANRDLCEIIPYCCNMQIPLNIITNGILLDEAWLNLLIQYLGRDSVISFSLDAVSQEVYEKVRGNYRLDELEKKIEYMMENRGNSGPRVGVNFVYEEDNYSEINVFLDKWKYKVDVVRINVALNSQRKIPTIYKKEAVNKKSIVCPYLQETMVIDAGGEVRSCQYDAFGITYLGNVFEEGIMQIWNGEKMEMLRQKHRQNQLISEDYCFECEFDRIYNFDRTVEMDDFILKIADYAVYYNRK
ncbi:MAG: radical SAM protein [Lachnospiraceae bacterium]|nr:radical SAM protein [Lachnospiraceae bacterium]